MCLIIFSYNVHPDFKLALAANRDEFYDRPTAPIDFWKDQPDILAGRDLLGGGTWLGVSRNGRFAAITNFRNPGWEIANAPSRGFLVSNFLDADESPQSYLEQVKSIGKDYNGFNILVGDESNIWFYSNIGNEVTRINSGLYGLSNKLLNTPWPKIEKGKAFLKKVLEQEEKLNPEDIFHILHDNFYPPDHMLPDTGVGLNWERVLSPLFITSRFYGTRSSSIILVERNGRTTFLERTFVSENGVSKEEKTRKFSFETSV